MKSINLFLKNWAEKNNIPCFFEPLVDSTSTWAKRDFKNDEFAIYLADAQTHGRGRNQNTWKNADAGSTLLSTWCLKSESSPQPIFPMRVGLCLFESFRSAWPAAHWSLKAPNDIYLSGRKLAGILVEAEQTGTHIKIFIGIGANILAKPEVDQPTAALNEELEVAEKDIEKFFFLFTQSLRVLQTDPHRQKLLPQEQARLLTALKQYPENQIKDISPTGTLTLLNNTQLPWQNL
jgi:biotin-[acetyl-CoA-carboxylase] ligase BirA-like protein